VRLNIYSQELTKEVELVSKTADTGITYYGVRMFLASPKVLHHTDDDDDRSAITFWIPNAQSMSQDDLARVFYKLSELVETAPIPPRND